MPLFKLSADSKTGLLPLKGILDCVSVDEVLVKVEVNRVAGRHHVVVVHHLSKKTISFLKTFNRSMI